MRIERGLQLFCKLAIGLLNIICRSRRGDTQNFIWIFQCRLRIIDPDDVTFCNTRSCLRTNADQSERSSFLDKVTPISLMRSATECVIGRSSCFIRRSR